jgi:hypothetical protein
MIQPFPARAAALLLLVVPSFAAAQDLPSSEQYHLRGEYARWRPGLGGTLQKGFGAEAGTLLDVSQDLGIGDQQTWQVRGTVRFSPSIKLRGGYTPLEYQGDTSAPTNFTYGDQSFFLGERVVSNISGKYYNGEIEWDLRKGQAGFFGLFLGAKVFDLASVVVAPGSGKRVTQENVVPIPVLGVAGRTFYGKRVSVEGEFSGMTLGSRGHVWETNLVLRFHLSDRLAVGAGYHRLSLTGQDKNGRDTVDIKLGGWTYGAELSL